MLQRVEKEKDLLIISEQTIRDEYTKHCISDCKAVRDVIIKHNDKLKHNPDLEFRDQGFTRPQVLILCPFRHDAYDIINMLIKYSAAVDVKNKQKFMEQFSSDDVMDSTKPGTTII
jgi:U3 small nucleolar RNA-associated protein 25